MEQGQLRDQRYGCRPGLLRLAREVICGLGCRFPEGRLHCFASLQTRRDPDAQPSITQNRPFNRAESFTRTRSSRQSGGTQPVRSNVAHLKRCVGSLDFAARTRVVSECARPIYDGATVGPDSIPRSQARCRHVARRELRASPRCGEKQIKRSHS